MIEPPAPRPEPLATGRAWAVCLSAVGVIALGTVGLRVWDEAAWAQYTEARAEYSTVLDDAVESARDLAVDRRAATQSLDTAKAISDTVGGVVGEETLAALTEKQSRLATVLDETEADSEWQHEEVPALDETALLWELLTSTAQLREASESLTLDRERLEATATRVRTANNALANDAVAVINAVGDFGQAELGRYPSATNNSYRALKSAAEGAVAMTRLSHRADGIVADVLEARDAMVASHKAKEAAKAGPLKATRDEVEAFARSIAGGVRLDFTWKDIVIGHGQGRSAAGTATWDTADEGYSSITLTNSIARYWTTWPGYRSLVAHEVGHAITSKCYDLFNTDLFGGDNERWATAWAIGKGYTVAAANGSDLYGKPTQAQIEATTACR